MLLSLIQKQTSILGLMPQPTFGYQFHEELHHHHDDKGELIAFHQDGQFYKDSPYITALFTYTEVMEAFATQDIAAYQYESAENFIVPLDRYPTARPSTEVYPATDQVLALRIKVQTAHQFGMMTLPARERLTITSGVPIKSVVGAMDHKGRSIDLKSLATLEWKILISPREQSPCLRGMCFLPSLEVFHAYRTSEEHSDGTPIIMSLPAYEPSQHKDVRAQRARDAPGTHPDLLYCEFKGCSIVVYGQINKCPIGSNNWPGWGPMAILARFYLNTDPKGKSKGKGKGSGRGRSGFSHDLASNPDKPPKGKGRKKGRGKGKSGSRDETQSREDKGARPDPKGPNTVPDGWENRGYEDIPIVQNARQGDHDVAAYVQGTSEIPTFRVVWMTFLGTMPRATQVSPID